MLTHTTHNMTSMQTLKTFLFFKRYFNFLFKAVFIFGQILYMTHCISKHYIREQYNYFTQSFSHHLDFHMELTMLFFYI